jgi:hypothetical protein
MTAQEVVHAFDDRAYQNAKIEMTCWLKRFAVGQLRSYLYVKFEDGG